MDHLSFIPPSKSPKSEPSDDVSTPMDCSIDYLVKEEIIENDENENNYNDYDDNLKKLDIIEHPKLLKTTPRTVVITPKQSKGPIAISKQLSKPVFIPINLSNVKTIKV